MKRVFIYLFLLCFSVISHAQNLNNDYCISRPAAGIVEMAIPLSQWHHTSPEDLLNNGISVTIKRKENGYAAVTRTVNRHNGLSLVDNILYVTATPHWRNFGANLTATFKDANNNEVSQDLNRAAIGANRCHNIMSCISRPAPGIVEMSIPLNQWQHSSPEELLNTGIKISLFRKENGYARVTRTINRDNGLSIIDGMLYLTTTSHWRNFGSNITAIIWDENNYALTKEINASQIGDSCQDSNACFSRPAPGVVKMSVPLSQWRHSSTENLLNEGVKVTIHRKENGYARVTRTINRNNGLSIADGKLNITATPHWRNFGANITVKLWDQKNVPRTQVINRSQIGSDSCHNTAHCISRPAPGVVAAAIPLSQWHHESTEALLNTGIKVNIHRKENGYASVTRTISRNNGLSIADGKLYITATPHWRNFGANITVKIWDEKNPTLTKVLNAAEIGADNCHQISACIMRPQANLVEMNIPLSRWNHSSADALLNHGVKVHIHRKENGYAGVTRTINQHNGLSIENGVLTVITRPHWRNNNSNITAKIWDKNNVTHTKILNLSDVGLRCQTDPTITDYTRAPNSYIFTGEDTQGNAVNGLYVPVGKAYDMWQQNYLDAGETLPTGTENAKVYWEDVPGLIRNVSIEGSGRQAKIKVEINKTKGEGNAVVSYHINDDVYWSWHIWVTDDPTNGVAYGHTDSTWPELDGENNVFTPQFMDRNLGAVSANIFGKDWHKSGGLMYQWGRKDPFPPLKHKDESFYLARSEANDTYYSLNPFYSNVQQIPFVGLPHDDVKENLKYSVQNPLNFIRPTEAKTWWGSSGNTFPQDDLWASATNGNTTDNPVYKNKSPYDPCPDGWRVPSFRASTNATNIRSPWGRQSDNIVIDHLISLDPTQSISQDSGYRNVKIYPSLGFDFSNVADRNIGLMPNTGGIYGQHRYLDNLAAIGLWGATSRRNNLANGLLLNHDPHRFDVSEFGTTVVNPFTDAFISSGAAVRCMQDPNVALANYQFETEYFGQTDTDIVKTFSDGIDDPNAFIVMNNNPNEGAAQTIALRKAYAMYNQYLTDHQWPASGQRAVSVYWTDNKALVNQLSRTGSGSETDEMTVTLNPKEFGNAVVALHQDGIDSDVLWSWHIWVPKEDPTADTYTHTTEPILQGADEHIVNPTRSGFPPITTEFMPMNLGALNAFPSISSWASATAEQKAAAKNSGGLHFQWGRKDPLPIAIRAANGGRYNIYRQVGTDENGIVYGNAIHDINRYHWATTNIRIPSPYNANYTQVYDIYAANAGVLPQEDRHKAAQKVLKYSVANPLTFLYQPANGCVANGPGCEGTNNFYDESLDWISNERGLWQNRWGHGTDKSAFDPCPSGWRVPDVTIANATESINFDIWANQGAHGNSPWYFSKAYRNWQGQRVQDFGIPLSRPARIFASNNYPNNTYPGRIITHAGWHLFKYAWLFQHDDYKIGNIPSTGIRGSDGGNDFMTDDPTGQVTIDSSADYYYRTGLWTAGMSSISGHAIALEIHYNRMKSGSFINPMASMGLRCARHKDADFAGIDYRAPTQDTVEN